MADLLIKPTKRTRERAIAITACSADDLPTVRKSLSDPQKSWLDAHGFAAANGRHLALPDENGGIARVLFGLGKGSDDPACERFAPAALATALPEGTYRFDPDPPAPELVALGWLLHGYAFTRYGKTSNAMATLVAPDGCDVADVKRIANAAATTRDLINTPAEDMGPQELESAMRALASAHKAKLSVVKGADLRKRNFPLIHAVGRASDRPPRLIDMIWGRARDPKVTLVGKGVCFDTGGLNLKPGNSMALMKKDMGGAANVLGLAEMIMSAGLRVRLRVLVPAVDNNVSANAFRPGDIFKSRNGMTVEIGNTDAEGRLILADALDLADADAPELLVDMATLTGAARVALGPDLPPFYTDDDDLAAEIAAHADAVEDLLWRMPFWNRYDSLLDSKVADINHISDGPFAGSLTAALFLRRFVERAGSYVHFDIFGWTPSARPGRPRGGADQGIRALYSLLRARYGG